MSGISQEQQEEIRRLQAEYLAKGGEIHRCPQHAASTGSIRFNFASRAQREREEAIAAEKMNGIRNGQ